MNTRWKNKLQLGDVWKNEDLPFLEQRDEIVRRIKRSPWYKRGVASEDEGDIDWIVDDLEHAEDYDEFNFAWSDFYDWCDVNKRVWIELWGTVKA